MSTFFVLFSVVIGAWLCVMMYGSYVWNLCLAYYRVLGISMSILIIVVAGLCWLALANRKAGVALATLVLIAIGLKFAYWGYYVPEWNYRYSQGPWARAIAQWVPRKWTLYTIHEWPPDLAFFTKRSVRQLYSPQLPRIPTGQFGQVCAVAPLGIRKLAQFRPSDHAGRQVPGCVGWRAHPGPHARPLAPSSRTRPRLAQLDPKKWGLDLSARTDPMS